MQEMLEHLLLVCVLFCVNTCANPVLEHLLEAFGYHRHRKNRYYYHQGYHLEHLFPLVVVVVR
jgi:hypothetical protein